MVDNIYKDLAYPGVYDDENKIIPYSPRRRFGFTSSEAIIKLESMENMPIDQIVELYRNGYRIEDTSPTATIMTAQGGITISTGALLLIGIGVLAYLHIKKK